LPSCSCLKFKANMAVTRSSAFVVDVHREVRALLKNHAIAVAIGLIFGFVMVWWVRPETSAGAIFLVFATTILCFVLGAILQFIVSSRKPQSSPRKNGRKLRQ
jgi:peptidoglycan/LPS O-acetylase OafA/YrhL